MKRIILLILLLTHAWVSQAQTVFPMKGATWHYMVENGGFIGPYYYTHTKMNYLSDTLIQGHTAAVIRYSSPFLTLGWNKANYFYSSHDSVFVFNAYSLNKWQLLYDFGASAGQSWQLEFKSQHPSFHDTTSWTIHVDSADLKLINGINLRRLYVTYSSTMFNYHGVVLERIGDVRYMLNFPDFHMESLCDGCPHLMGLLCYQDSTFSLYQPDSLKSCDYVFYGVENYAESYPAFSVYPNPAMDILNISCAKPLVGVWQIELYDALGKRVLKETRNGLGNLWQLNTAGLDAGIYYYTLSSDGLIRQRSKIQLIN